MKDTEQQIKSFAMLPLSQKKGKILVMLDKIKDTDEVFASFEVLLNTMEDVPEDLIDFLYTYMMMLGDAIEKWNNEETQQHFESIKKRLEEIQKQEKKEQQDADAIIENIQ